MRKYIIISLFAALFHTDVKACAWEGPTHNHYMFSVFRRECMAHPFADDINAFWRTYAADKEDSWGDYFSCNKDKLLAVARQKGDRQMVEYIGLMADYLAACDKVSTAGWDYPRKEDIREGQAALRQIKTRALAGTDGKYRTLNTVLVMRANMMLGLDAENIGFWEARQNKTVPGVWQSLAQNIYARALLKAGRKREACDIYAAQGDMQSIKWLTRKYRNLAGIQKLYAEDPNSPTLLFLVQDFVNNAQETLDSKPADADDENWLREIGSMPVYKKEVLDFIAFADKVVADGKSDSPCLWRTASGMLRWLFGLQKEAEADLKAAMTLPGPPRMKDNARCIRLLASVKNAQLGPAYSAWLLQEFKWLETKIQEERGRGDGYENHYTDVLDRVIYKALIPKYEEAGMHLQAMALYGMIREVELDFITHGNHAREGLHREGDYVWNTDYADFNEYFRRLDKASAKEVKGFYAYLTSPRKDVFDDYVAHKVYANPQYYYDLIGTKYMAEGDFAAAIPYLEKVSPDFLAKQDICYYMAHRDYTVERWFRRQKLNEDKPADEPLLAKPAENQKLKYCREMLKLRSQYKLAPAGAKKEELAYALAVRYFQASPYGDCWFLTAYGSACVGLMYGDKEVAERWKRPFDFAGAAVALLKECKRSESAAMRYKALYALAFIPVEPWYTTDWDSNYEPVRTFHPASAQYKALGELYRFAKAHPRAVDAYTTRCDVLKQFVAQGGGK